MIERILCNWLRLHSWQRFAPWVKPAGNGYPAELVTEKRCRRCAHHRFERRSL